MGLFFQIYATFVIVVLFISIACYCMSLIYEDKSEDICDIMEQVSKTAFMLDVASLTIMFFVLILIDIWK